MLQHSSNPLAKGQLLMQLHATLGDFCGYAVLHVKMEGLLQCLSQPLAFLRNISLVRKPPLGLFYILRSPICSLTQSFGSAPAC